MMLFMMMMRGGAVEGAVEGAVGRCLAGGTAGKTQVNTAPCQLTDAVINCQDIKQLIVLGTDFRDLDLSLTFAPNHL